MMQKGSIIAFILVTLFFSCRKESIGSNCNSLKEGIDANDPGKVKTAIANFIERSGNESYNESNIKKLCEYISSNCNLTARYDCYNCVYTLPAQTEILLSFSSGGSIKTKVIDLSYSLENKIIFRNMHD
jgi:hypothetical protein